MNPNRLAAICHLMEKHQAEQLIISDPSTIFYLTGTWFSPGERLSALLVKQTGDTLLINNELFPLPENFKTPTYWIKDTDDQIRLMADLITCKKIAVDKNWPARFLIPLMELLPDNHFSLATPITDGARLIKDASEQNLMRHASSLNDSAMKLLSQEVTEGVTEKQLAKRLAEIYVELNTDGFSFDPIVAFGANGADPHHEIDDTPIKNGDSIIIDIGCKKDSYSSDMTRTFFFQEVSEKSREVYETVKEANLLAIQAAKPGNRFSDVDKAARDYISAKGYGEYFTHRTGHGIGIDVHEPEDVSSSNDSILKPGMIFSIEPGIYLSGEIGVRIEDLVLITEDGCEVLNEVSKDLTILESKE